MAVVTDVASNKINAESENSPKNQKSVSSNHNNANTTSQTDELLDYEEEEQQAFSLADAKSTSQANKKASESTNVKSSTAPSQIKGAYSSIHSSGFRDFILKPELMTAIKNAGFEHPSTVQHETIPQAILGMDILCQAKSGMGKTAVFVISTLQLLNTKSEETSVLAIAHTRELALQISKEYERFSKYLPVSVECFVGGVLISKDIERLEKKVPHIVV